MLCECKWDQISTLGFIKLYSRFTKTTWINLYWSCGYYGWISKATEVFITQHFANWAINFPLSQLPVFQIICLTVLQFCRVFIYYIRASYVPFPKICIQYAPNTMSFLFLNIKRNSSCHVNFPNTRWAKVIGVSFYFYQCIFFPSSPNYSLETSGNFLPNCQISISVLLAGHLHASWVCTDIPEYQGCYCQPDL